MSASVDRILEILDVGLQDTTPAHYGYGEIADWIDVSAYVRHYTITVPTTATMIVFDNDDRWRAAVMHEQRDDPE